MVTPPDNPEFIIQGSLLGFGLVIAVYTLVYPKIENILEKNLGEVNILEKKLRKQYSEFTVHQTKKREEIIENMKGINQQIQEKEKLPLDLYWWFIITFVFFGVPLFVYGLPVFGINWLRYLETSTAIFFWGGVLIFAILCISIFIRMNSLVRENFDKKLTKLRKEIEKKESAKDTK